MQAFVPDTGQARCNFLDHVADLRTDQRCRPKREERAMKAWSSKEAEFIKSKPDYVEKVQNARTLPISTEVQEALRESEFGPQVAYHLVENPEVARAILQLSPSAQLREIGRIEARLEAAKAKPAPAVSQAPPPPYGFSRR